jgi:hypothetical protein
MFLPLEKRWDKYEKRIHYCDPGLPKSLIETGCIFSSLQTTWANATLKRHGPVVLTWTIQRAYAKFPLLEIILLAVTLSHLSRVASPESFCTHFLP